MEINKLSNKIDGLQYITKDQDQQQERPYERHRKQEAASRGLVEVTTTMKSLHIQVNLTKPARQQWCWAVFATAAN